MKITEISRTISGANYSNISAKATIDDGDDFLTAAAELDALLNKALNHICEVENNRVMAEFRSPPEPDVGIPF